MSVFDRSMQQESGALLNIAIKYAAFSVLKEGGRQHTFRGSARLIQEADY